MKKLMSVPAMLVILLFILVGCSNGGNESSASPTDEVSASVVETDAVSETSEDEEVSTDVTEDQDTPVRGIWTDSTYTNSYMNLTFSMPDTWVYASDEDIANTMSIAAENLSEAGLELSEDMLEQQSIYDMMSQSTTTTSSVMVMYENLSMTIGGSMYTEELYLNSVKKQLEDLEMGYTFPDDITTTTIGEETYSALNTEYGEGELYQTYYVRKINNYMTCIIISAKGGDSVEDILSYLS